jgi:D-3-phosphoglycerate dehydrogenase / 2-oxoglutarate reductase
MAESLSLRVLFYDSVSIMPIGRAEPVQSLDALLPQCDFVVCLVTASPENNNLFDASRFAKMKQGAYFINVSYAGAVKEQALADALKSGHLAGAAVDVLSSYPVPPVDGEPALSASVPTPKHGIFNSPLRDLSNVIFTPSIGTRLLFSRINYRVILAYRS